jgi:hypothetical protein
MACELVRVQFDETIELRRHFFDDDNRVRRDGGTPCNGVSAL